jgi:conjugative relaxase-like TrwC/TraI family protein
VRALINVAKATSAEYYTSAAGVSAGMESYYLDAVTDGEPPGRWQGKGAEALGLHGDVDADVMHTVYGEFRHPVTGEAIGTRPAQRKSVDERLAEAIAAEPGALPERIAELRRSIERSDRKNVIGWDATFNIAKSVTIVHTSVHREELAAIRSGDDDRAEEFGRIRAAIEGAIHDANSAAMQTLEELAVARTGGGSGAPLRWVPAEGVTIASFLQHTNRLVDPHLHVHNVVLNRVHCADGEIRALDGRDLLAQRFFFSAVADRVLGERLAELGIPLRLRADGVGREVPFISQDAIDFFSGRRHQVTATAEPLLEAAREKAGRELSEREVYYLMRQATLASRDAKTHDGESREELVDRWWADLVSTTGQRLESIAEATRDAVRSGPVAAETWSPASVISEAVAACAARSSTWRRANLINEIELRLPTLGLARDKIQPLLEMLADQALAGDDVQQVSGLDVGEYAAPSARLFAAAGTLAAEAALRKAAVVRGRQSADVDAVSAWLDQHAPTMGADQRAAVLGIAGSDAALSVLIGPAGTGKSYAAGALANSWRDVTGGRVVGLAVSEIATEVLRDDGIADSANVSAWLAAQERLAGATAEGDDERWQLTSSDVVMVDESSMISTTKLDSIRQLVDAAGARLVLTGDPRQLAAVEAGGALGLLDGRAETYYLSEVRRFAEEWEREASLALRGGDRDALVEYERHGRFVQLDGVDAALDSAARAAVADRLDGRSVVVVAGTNKQAAQISVRVRDQLVSLGLVDADGVLLGRDGCTAGVGDLIACRRNDYGLGVTNRAQYRVTEVAGDGSLVVEPLVGGAPVRLPAAYVQGDVELGYASTVHAAQGITVDSAHLVTDGGLDAAALYVGMSRGRIRNTAHVAVEPEAAELPAVDGTAGGQTRLAGDAPRASALAVLETSLERDGEALAATVAAERDAERRASMTTLSGGLETEVRLACRSRLESHLDELTAEGTLAPQLRASLAADQGTEYLSRLLRSVEQTGLDPRQALRDAVLGGESGRRSLQDSKSVAQVLSYRVGIAHDVDLPRIGDGLPAGVPHEHAERLRQLTDAVGARRAELGSQVAEQAPEWAVLALGPVPDPVNTANRADWERRAGVAAGHREATGWDDPEQALGRAPGPSTTERRADYTTAWRALGRPQPRLEEAQLSDGQLLARVRAWQREQQWAPAHADDALRAAEHAAEQSRQEAALAAAEGRLEDAEKLRGYAELKATAAARFAELTRARSVWAARTGVTRARAEAAIEELAARGVTIGAEPDRTTASAYLTYGQGADSAHLEDEDRLVTEADVREVSEADDLWAAQLDDLSPEVPLEQRQALAETLEPALVVAPVEPSAGHIELMVAQAGLALTVAADQASQDDAWQAKDDRQKSEASFDAGRLRREAAELDAGAERGAERGLDAGVDLDLVRDEESAGL